MAVYNESVGESMTITEASRFRQMFSLTDPATSAVFLPNFGSKSPDYASAQAAYSAWAAELGVSETGTDTSIGTVTSNVTWVELPFAPIDGSANPYILPAHGAGLFFWKQQLDPDNEAITTGQQYGYTTQTPYTNFISLKRALLTLAVYAGLYYNPGLLSGFKIRSLGERTIIYYSIKYTGSGTPNEINVAWRLGPGYVEMVFTPVIATTEVNMLIISYNEDTNAGYLTRQTESLLQNTTRHYISDDLGLYRGSVVETIGQTDTNAVKWTLDSPQSDGIRFDMDRHAFGWPKTLTDSPQFSDTAAYTWRPGAIAADVIRMQDTFASEFTYGLTLTDRPRMVDAIAAAFPATVTDTTSVAAVANTASALVVLERLGLTEAVLGNGVYAPTLAQSLRVLDSLSNFFGMDLTDTVGMADTTLQAFKRAGALADSIGVAENVQEYLILRVVVSDQVDIDALDAVKLIYDPTLAETIEISAGYVSPGSTFTTWVVNTGTGAVTEYDNYVFNSFARVGHKYLGASDSGLYELNGNTDQGTSIIADIKSGYLQFGGSRFSSFKAAYLGLRSGSSDYVLRIIAGDGNTYNYAVKAQSMKTTKVLMGKGLRARYFAYELISTGQDFDLDSIEFVPLVAQRRV